jgi:hypothetical protein
MIHVQTEHVKKGRRLPKPPKLSSQQEIKLAAETIEQERRIMAEVYPHLAARSTDLYNGHLR